MDVVTAVPVTLDKVGVARIVYVPTTVGVQPEKLHDVPVTTPDPAATVAPDVLITATATVVELVPTVPEIVTTPAATTLPDGLPIVAT
jgi:hypothetical protein